MLARSLTAGAQTLCSAFVFCARACIKKTKQIQCFGSVCAIKMQPLEVSYKLYIHEHYHSALLEIMAEAKYAKVEDLFAQVRELVHEPREIMLAKDCLMLSRTARVPYSALSNSTRETIREALHSDTVEKCIHKSGDDGQYITLVGATLQQKPCVLLVLTALYTVLLAVYRNDAQSAAALFDAVLQMVMQVFKVEYEHVVDACAPFGYGALPGI